MMIPGLTAEHIHEGGLASTGGTHDGLGSKCDLLA